jgi:hypothetical protein
MGRRDEEQLAIAECAKPKHRVDDRPTDLDEGKFGGDM